VLISITEGASRELPRIAGRASMPLNLHSAAQRICSSKGSRACGVS